MCIWFIQSWEMSANLNQLNGLPRWSIKWYNLRSFIFVLTFTTIKSNNLKFSTRLCLEKLILPPIHIGILWLIYIQPLKMTGKVPSVKYSLLTSSAEQNLTFKTKYNYRAWEILSSTEVYVWDGGMDQMKWKSEVFTLVLFGRVFISGSEWKWRGHKIFLLQMGR